MDIFNDMMNSIKSGATPENNIPTINDVLALTRHKSISDFSPLFLDLFSGMEGAFLAYGVKKVEDTINDIVDKIIIYSKTTGINNFIIGMSGGADSAVTLALLREAQKVKRDIQIRAYTLPIYSNTNEILRAREACDFLGVKMHQANLTDMYENSLSVMTDNFESYEDKEENIRRGNIKARLRMIYLYDKARYFNGVVVSTDNFSEYMAGFWTINGDVGDISPIQFCFKSTEVTAIGKQLGLPEKIWKAIPTDGLGISQTDEDQLGVSYLEFDLLTMRLISSYFYVYIFQPNVEIMTDEFSKIVKENFLKFRTQPNIDEMKKVNAFYDRVSKSWFKRLGVIKFENNSVPKAEFIRGIDNCFIPEKLAKIIC